MIDVNLIKEVLEDGGFETGPYMGSGITNPCLAVIVHKVEPYQVLGCIVTHLLDRYRDSSGIIKLDNIDKVCELKIISAPFNAEKKENVIYFPELSWFGDQNWKVVLNFLRNRENMTADLNTICAGLPQLSRETIRDTLKELINSGDIIDHPPFPSSGNKTWEALT